MRPFGKPVYEREEYSLYQFFPDKRYERVLSLVDLRTAVIRARNLAESVGGRIGIVQRIIVTDGGDFTIFEWKFGKGITFPPGTVFPPRDLDPQPKN